MSSLYGGFEPAHQPSSADRHREETLLGKDHYRTNGFKDGFYTIEENREHDFQDTQSQTSAASQISKTSLFKEKQFYNSLSKKLGLDLEKNSFLAFNSGPLQLGEDSETNYLALMGDQIPLSALDQFYSIGQISDKFQSLLIDKDIDLKKAQALFDDHFNTVDSIDSYVDFYMAKTRQDPQNHFYQDKLIKLMKKKEEIIEAIRTAQLQNPQEYIAYVKQSYSENGVNVKPENIVKALKEDQSALIPIDYTHNFEIVSSLSKNRENEAQANALGNWFTDAASSTWNFLRTDGLELGKKVLQAGVNVGKDALVNWLKASGNDDHFTSSAQHSSLFQLTTEDGKIVNLQDFFSTIRIQAPVLIGRYERKWFNDSFFNQTQGFKDLAKGQYSNGNFEDLQGEFCLLPYYFVLAKKVTVSFDDPIDKRSSQLADIIEDVTKIGSFDFNSNQVLKNVSKDSKTGNVTTVTFQINEPSLLGIVCQKMGLFPSADAPIELQELHPRVSAFLQKKEWKQISNDCWSYNNEISGEQLVLNTTTNKIMLIPDGQISPLTEEETKAQGQSDPDAPVSGELSNWWDTIVGIGKTVVDVGSKILPAVLPILLQDEFKENLLSASCMEAPRNLKEEEKKDGGEGSMGSSIFYQESKLWINKKVLKVFFMDTLDEKRNQLVMTIAKHWETLVSITFERTLKRDESDIRITYTPKIGSWSNVGTDNDKISKSAPTMNFGWFKNVNDPIEKEYFCTTLHEFGHALGFEHELQCPYFQVPLDPQKCYDFYRGKSKQWVDQNVLNRLDQAVYRKGLTRFDPDSIMCYQINPALLKSGVPAAINRRNCYFSPLDCILAREAYSVPLTAFPLKSRVILKDAEYVQSQFRLVNRFDYAIGMVKYSKKEGEVIFRHATNGVLVKFEDGVKYWFEPECLQLKYPADSQLDSKEKEIPRLYPGTIVRIVETYDENYGQSGRIQIRANLNETSSGPSFVSVVLHEISDIITDPSNLVRETFFTDVSSTKTYKIALTQYIIGDKVVTEDLQTMKEAFEFIGRGDFTQDMEQFATSLCIIKDLHASNGILLQLQIKDKSEKELPLEWFEPGCIKKVVTQADKKVKGVNSLRLPFKAIVQVINTSSSYINQFGVIEKQTDGSRNIKVLFEGASTSVNIPETDVKLVKYFDQKQEDQEKTLGQDDFNKDNVLELYSHSLLSGGTQLKKLIAWLEIEKWNKINENTYAYHENLEFVFAANEDDLNQKIDLTSLQLKFHTSKKKEIELIKNGEVFYQGLTNIKYPYHECAEKLINYIQLFGTVESGTAAAQDDRIDEDGNGAIYYFNGTKEVYVRGEKVCTKDNIQNGQATDGNSVKYILTLDATSNDDSGHIIANDLGGTKEKFNLVPIDKQVNTGPMKSFEQWVKNQVLDGRNLYVVVEFVYGYIVEDVMNSNVWRQSKKPSSIHYTAYDVNSNMNPTLIARPTEIWENPMRDGTYTKRYQYIEA